MVAVADLDHPEEEKIKSEPMGVPTSAPPKDALAERAGARGTSEDVLPEERSGEAEGIADDINNAINRAGANFRRLSAGMHMIMAIRYYETPRKAEVIEETLATVPELAHSHGRAPDPYSPMAVGSDVYVIPVAAASESAGAAERSARSSASIASTADDVRVIMLQQELQLSKMRAQMELQATRFEEELKRKDMQSTFDMRQATLLAQAEAQSAVATAQLYAARRSLSSCVWAASRATWSCGC